MSDRRPTIVGKVAVPEAWSVEQRMAQLETITREAVLFVSLREWVDYLHERARVERAPGHTLAETYADVCLEAVQHVATYRADPPNEDWHQDTATTAKGGGDCEDLSALLCALLRLGAYFYGLKIRARLEWVRRDTGQDHVAVRVQVDVPEDAAWEWMEPSIRWARRGEAPEEAARRLGVRR